MICFQKYSREKPLAKRRPPWQSQKGMSLLEVMVSFSILVLVFIALVRTFPMAIAINKTAENATRASYLAQIKAEELNALGYDAIAAGTIEAKHRLSNDSTSYLFNFQRQTVVENVDGNLAASGSATGLKKITVTVFYANALSKTEKTYDLVTMISQW